MKAEDDDDELSDMEISDVDDDDDDDGNYSGRMKLKNDNVNVNVAADVVVDDDDKILSMIKQGPPQLQQLSNILDEFDTSDACIVEIDGHTLKKNQPSEYPCLLNYCYSCRQKRVLEYFTRPGEKDVDGGITSWEGNKLRGCRLEQCCEIATKAISKYNRLCKGGKLKLEKLIKVNTISGFRYYMTFSAINRDTGKSGIYQAALKWQDAGSFLLGLFRDWSNDKILAILSIKGAEEDLAAIRKMSEDAVAVAQAR